MADDLLDLSSMLEPDTGADELLDLDSMIDQDQGGSLDLNSMLGDAQLKPAEGSWLDDYAAAASHGWRQMESGMRSLGVMAGADPTFAAESIAETLRKTPETPERYASFQRKIMKEGKDVDDAEGMWDTLTEFSDLLGTAMLEGVKNPGAVGYLITESLAHSLVPLAPAAAGAMIGFSSPMPGGAAAGLVAGTGIGTFASEAGVHLNSLIATELTAQGRNFSEVTADDVLDVMNSEKFMDWAETEAAKRGLAMAAVEMMFAGMGGKLAKGTAKSIYGKTAKVTAGVGLETTGEMVGEAVGQAVTEGDISAGEIVLEGIAGAGTSVGTVALNQTIATSKDAMGGVAKQIRAQQQALAEDAAATLEVPAPPPELSPEENEQIAAAMEIINNDDMLADQFAQAKQDVTFDDRAIKQLFDDALNTAHPQRSQAQKALIKLGRDTNEAARSPVEEMAAGYWDTASAAQLEDEVAIQEEQDRQFKDITGVERAEPAPAPAPVELTPEQREVFDAERQRSLEATPGVLHTLADKVFLKGREQAAEAKAADIIVPTLPEPVVAAVEEAQAEPAVTEVPAPPTEPVVRSADVTGDKTLFREGTKEGRWWSDDAEYASLYGELGKASNKEAINLDSVNIFDWPANEDYGNTFLKDLAGDDFDAALKERGYDGVLIKGERGENIYQFVDSIANIKSAKADPVTKAEPVAEEVTPPPRKTNIEFEQDLDTLEAERQTLIEGREQENVKDPTRVENALEVAAAEEPATVPEYKQAIRDAASDNRWDIVDAVVERMDRMAEDPDDKEAVAEFDEVKTYADNVKEKAGVSLEKAIQTTIPGQTQQQVEAEAAAMEGAIGTVLEGQDVEVAAQVGRVDRALERRQAAREAAPEEAVPPPPSSKLEQKRIAAQAEAATEGLAARRAARQAEQEVKPTKPMMQARREAVALKKEIDAKAAEVDQSPTEAQIEAGNYKKPKVQLHGMEITIENNKGSTRSGTDQEGNAWSQEMKDHYGYISRSGGVTTPDAADGDKVDVFIGDHPESEQIFVVDQVDPKTGAFDEHKVIMGATSAKQARQVYQRNYAKGWNGLRNVTEMTVDEFKGWIADEESVKTAVIPQALDEPGPPPGPQAIARTVEAQQPDRPGGRERGPVGVEPVVEERPDADAEPDLGRQPATESRASAEAAASVVFDSLAAKDVGRVERIKRLGRRYLKAGGNMPKGTYHQKVLSNSNVRSFELTISDKLAVLDKAVTDKYGKKIEGMTDFEKKDLNDYFTGKSEGRTIPKDVRDGLDNMRGSMKQVSREYAGIIWEDIQELRAEGMDAAAEAKIELLTIISNNMETYLHRSYQAYDDPKWPTKVSKKVIFDATQYIMDGLAEQNPALLEDPGELERQAAIKVQDILKDGTAYESLPQQIRQSKLGAKDLSILKKRQDIAPEIRALLGEYDDVRLNYAKSLTKTAALVSNSRFLKSFREAGLEQGFLFAADNRPAGAETIELAAPGTESYAPLNGLYTYPHIEQAMQDQLGGESMANWLKTIVRLNGMMKYGKTVLSPLTSTANVMSAVWFPVANGHFNFAQSKRSLDHLTTYFREAGKAEKVEYLKKLTSLGVIYDTAFIGEAMENLKDANIGDAIFYEGPLKNVRKTVADMNTLAQRTYQFGDDFWKIIGFENEKAMLKKHKGLSDSAAETEAARIIRDTYPTYSQVGKAVRMIRRFPLAGTFVSFTAETIRTSANMVRLIAENAKDHPAYAAQKAVGLAAAYSAAFAFQTVTRDMWGVDDEEEEAIRDLAADWNQNSPYWYTGRDDQDRLQYIDMSFLMPYNFFQRPIIAAMRDQPVEDMLVQSATEALKPFFGADILAEAVVRAAIMNETPTGGEIYSPDDSVALKTAKGFNYVRKIAQPGVISYAEKIWAAGMGYKNYAGEQPKMIDEIGKITGRRLTTVDPERSIYFRADDFGDSLSNANQFVTRMAADYNEVTTEMLKAEVGRADAVTRQAYTDMIKSVEAARTLGTDDDAIRSRLSAANVGKDIIGALLDGEVQGYSMSKRSAQGLADRFKDDPDQQDIVWDRIDEIRGLE